MGDLENASTRPWQTAQVSDVGMTAVKLDRQGLD